MFFKKKFKNVSNIVTNIFCLESNLEISLVENRLRASHAITKFLLKNYLLCKL